MTQTLGARYVHRAGATRHGILRRLGFLSENIALSASDLLGCATSERRRQRPSSECTHTHKHTRSRSHPFTVIGLPNRGWRVTTDSSTNITQGRAQKPTNQRPTRTGSSKSGSRILSLILQWGGWDCCKCILERCTEQRTHLNNGKPV